MICTEQERAALMAAIGRYGDIREGIGLAIGTDAKSAAVALEEPAIAAIRAMLSRPPDDAVAVPRDLAADIRTALLDACQEIHDRASENRLCSLAEALRTVLRGESTRDE